MSDLNHGGMLGADAHWGESGETEATALLVEAPAPSPNTMTVPPPPEMPVETENAATTPTPEASEVDTKGDTPPPPVLADEYETLFRETGLDRKYRDPKDALRSHAKQEAYITRLQQENAELRRAKSEQDSKPPAAPVDLSNIQDELLTRPDVALEKLGFVRQDRVEKLEQRLSQLSRENAGIHESLFAQQHKDYPGLQDEMFEYYQEHPELSLAPASVTMPLVYAKIMGDRRANGNQPPATVVAAPVPQGKVVAARTTTASTQPKKREFTESDFRKMSVEQLEKHFGYGAD